MKTLRSIISGGSTSLQRKRTMNDLQKDVSTCLLAAAALLGGASAAFGADTPSQGTAPAVAVPSAALEKVARAMAGVLNPAKSSCNQGVGNGPEEYDDWNCDPGNSNQGESVRSNDQLGVPGNPGRKGGNK